MPQGSKRKGKGLRQLASGRWSVRYTDSNGRGRETSFETKTQAERFQHRLRHEQASGDWIDPEAGNVPLSVWAEEWLEARRSDLSDNSYRRYGEAIRASIVPALGDRHVGSIRPVDIQQAAAEWSETRAPSTVELALTVLRMIFASSVANGIRKSNPMTGVKGPRVAEREIEFLTPSELERVCAVSDQGPLWRFFGYTGMRLGEVRGLRVHDLEPLKSPLPIHVRRQTDRYGNDSETKGRKSRTIYASGPVESDLRERIIGEAPSDRVWTARDGGLLGHSAPNEAFQRAVRRAGIGKDLHLHQLRHTCASLLIHRGASPVAVSRWLGHAKVSITLDVYSGLWPDDLEHLAALMWKPVEDESERKAE